MLQPMMHLLMDFPSTRPHVLLDFIVETASVEKNQTPHKTAEAWRLLQQMASNDHQ